MFFSAVLILVRCVTVWAMNTTNMFSFGSTQNVVPPAPDHDISPIDRGFDNFYGWTRGYGVNSWFPEMMIRLPQGRPQFLDELRERPQHRRGLGEGVEALAGHRPNKPQAAATSSRRTGR